MRNYLLLTPGPLSTSQTVREAMLQDWCTWDKDYNEGIVTPIRKGLLAIAGLMRTPVSCCKVAERIVWRLRSGPPCVRRINC